MKVKDGLLQLLSAGGAFRTTTLRDLMRKDYNLPMSTGSVRYALHKLRKQGLTERTKIQGDAHGSKEWSLVQGAIIPVPSTATKVVHLVVQSTSATVVGSTKPTLDAAIEHLITQNILAKKNFSAHDITKQLRDKVNSHSGLVIDVAETGVVHVGADTVARIDHDYVRGVVHEFYNQGKMTGYDRESNGKYLEYKVQQANTVLPDPGTTSTSSQDPSNYDGSPTL